MNVGRSDAMINLPMSKVAAVVLAVLACAAPARVQDLPRGQLIELEAGLSDVTVRTQNLLRLRDTLSRRLPATGRGR